MKSNAAEETDRTAADCPRYDQRLVRCAWCGDESQECHNSFTTDPNKRAYFFQCHWCGAQSPIADSYRQLVRIMEAGKVIHPSPNEKAET